MLRSAPSNRTKNEMAKNTSWEPVSSWYNKQVGDEGHYFHQHIVLPGVKRLLRLQPDSRILDLGCGNGILVSQVPNGTYYQGVDVSASLIAAAKKTYPAAETHFTVADVTRSDLPIQRTDFTHATIILALQNMKTMGLVFGHLQRHLADFGKVVIVLNHPSFRIPRQSSWQIDDKTKTQYRRVDRYFTDLEIPIKMHPGQERSPLTWSFHHPLQTYVSGLNAAGLVISQIEEWTSDKQSVGKAAKMENRGRADFPLFLTIVAHKLPAEVLRQMK